MKKLLFLLIFCLPILVKAQSTETHHYAIEVAGIRVGTMTAMRQQHPDDRSTYTLISDVKVKLLIYTITVYYKAITQFTGEKLMFATVDTRTNRGNYTSRTEWKGDHYVLSVNQYKYDRQAIERNSIDFSVSSLYFYEPIDRHKAYAEYFGDYFLVSKTAPGTYRALLDEREDEYIYEKGRLVKVIKHNKLKNFIVRLLD